MTVVGRGGGEISLSTALATLGTADQIERAVLHGELLNLLDSKERKVFEMKQEGFSSTEIAEHQGRSVAAVDTTCCRARERIRMRCPGYSTQDELARAGSYSPRKSDGIRTASFAHAVLSLPSVAVGPLRGENDDSTTDLPRSRIPGRRKGEGRSSSIHGHCARLRRTVGGMGQERCRHGFSRLSSITWPGGAPCTQPSETIGLLQELRGIGGRLRRDANNGERDAAAQSAPIARTRRFPCGTCSRHHSDAVAAQARV